MKIRARSGFYTQILYRLGELCKDFCGFYGGLIGRLEFLIWVSTRIFSFYRFSHLFLWKVGSKWYVKFESALATLATRCVCKSVLVLHESGSFLLCVCSQLMAQYTKYDKIQTFTFSCFPYLWACSYSIYDAFYYHTGHSK